MTDEQFKVIAEHLAEIRRYLCFLSWVAVAACAYVVITQWIKAIASMAAYYVGL